MDTISPRRPRVENVSEPVRLQAGELAPDFTLSDQNGRSLTLSALLGWLALAVGVLWGAGSLVIGVRVGGRILDRTGPALLARMRRTGG